LESEEEIEELITAGPENYDDTDEEILRKELHKQLQKVDYS
jgi:hypothetical protein